MLALNAILLIFFKTTPANLPVLLANTEFQPIITVSFAILDVQPVFLILTITKYYAPPVTFQVDISSIRLLSLAQKIALQKL